MQRRMIGSLITVVGVVFVVTVLGNQLFTASGAFERLSDDVRPIMNEESLATLRADAASLTAVSQELGGAVLPTIADALGVDQAELATRFAGDFPATAAGAIALPVIAAELEARIDVLEAQVPNFERADAIPTEDTTSMAVPWFILLTGVAAILVGAWIMRPGVTAAVVALVLGAVMLATPLVTQLIGKSADADALNEAVRPVFTAQTVQEQREAFAIIQAMGTELQEKLVPDLASQLNISPEQAGAFVQQNFPVLAQAQENLPAALQRFSSLTATIETNIDEFEDASRPTLEPIAWTVVGGGIATMVLAGLAMAVNRRAAEQAEARRALRVRRAA